MSGLQNQIVSTSNQPTGTSFVERAIEVDIKLGRGTDGNLNQSFDGTGGSDTVTLAGLRIYATVNLASSPSMARAEVRIFGMTESLMNQVSSIGTVPGVYQVRQNTITIRAGDVGQPLSTVFFGNISEAFQMFNTQPETFMQFNANQALVLNAQPVPATSFQGTADVATLMAGFAKEGNYRFINNNVNVKISNPYYSGTPKNKIELLAKDARIHVFFGNDGSGNTVEIAPINTPSNGGVIPLISPASGLIGYPDYISNGIKFRTLFNPNLTYNRPIEMKSDLQPANGTWTLNKVSYNLSCLVPGGPWFCDCEASYASGIQTPGGR